MMQSSLTIDLVDATPTFCKGSGAWALTQTLRRMCFRELLALPTLTAAAEITVAFGAQARGRTSSVTTTATSQLGRPRAAPAAR